MHLLIVHQNFVDHAHPGGTRHLELARHLVRRGHQCTIVAGSVDYLSGKRLPRRSEQIDGVQIRRAYAPATIHHSYAGRALSYACFMITSVWHGVRVREVDVVLGTSPPMFQLPSAWLVATVKRRPFVLEVRDLWPRFAVDLGVLRNRLLIHFAERVERFFYRHNRAVVANSPGFVPYLREQGIAPEKLHVVPNGVDTSMFRPQDRGAKVRTDLALPQEAFVVTYAGALGEANDIDTILRAAERLRDRPQIRFLLVGGGKQLPRLSTQVAQRDLHNVILGGHFAKQQMPDVLAASNLCLATLRDLEMFRTTYPNKIFDYMAAGRPTLVAIDGAARDVIEQARGGTFIPPGNDALLAQTIVEYEQDRSRCSQEGTNARRYVQRHFERSDQAEALEQVLAEVAEQDHRSWYQRHGKRWIDVLLTIPLSILLLPVIALTSLCVRWRLGTPVLFRQQRAGKNGKPFTLYKFRTMRDALDDRGQPLPDAARLTHFGQWLRSLSLDELPQLWNILRGDMSLVGPRPLLTRYLPRYSARQARRHITRPGVTGWAQVNGRNAISWEKKFELDVWYVEHCTLFLDLRILWRTFIQVALRRGVRAEGHATMPEFTGSPQRNEPVIPSSAAAAESVSSE